MFENFSIIKIALFVLLLLITIWMLWKKKFISYNIPGGIIKDKNNYPVAYWISIILNIVLILILLLFSNFKNQ